MITKKEVDNILTDVNRVLANMTTRMDAIAKDVDDLKAKQISTSKAAAPKTENKA